MKNEVQTKKQKLIHRMKIIQGHLKSIEKMIDEDAYCIDIIHQSRAVQTALKKMDMVIIDNHLHHCVIDQVKNGEEKKAVEELLALFNFK